MTILLFFTRFALPAFVNPLTAAFLMSLANVPLWIALPVLCGTTLVVNFFIYLFARVVAKRITKGRLVSRIKKHLKDYFNQVYWDDWILGVTHLSALLPRLRGRKSKKIRQLTQWMERQKIPIIFFLLCIPFLPWIPNAATVVLSKIPSKYNIAILFASSIFRTSIMTITIYFFS